MEEKDIDIIEDMINNCEEHIKIYNEAFVVLEEIKSVKNLLQAYKQDEKIIFKMAKAWKQDDIRSVDEIIDYFRKKCD